MIVVMPNGEQLGFPDDMDEKEIAKILSERDQNAQKSTPAAPQEAPAAPKARGWGDVPGEALRNAPASAGRFFGGIYDAVTSPLETGKALADLAAGAARAGVRAVAPNEVFDTDNSKRQDEIAAAAWKALKARYGGAEEIKNTLATDPVGAMADVSSVLSLGAGATPKLATAAKLTDPVQLAAEGAKLAGQGGAWLGRATLGTTTGAGADAVRVAYQTGKEGGAAADAFRKNMRGAIDEAEILDDARRGMKKIERQRASDFDRTIANATNQAPMDMAPIVANVDRLVDTATYKGKPIVGDKEWNVIQKARSEVADWANDPTLHSPEGINALRKKIDAIYPSPEMRQAQRIVGDISRDLNLRVATAEPAFAKANAAWAESRNLSNQLEKTMSLSGRAADDTTLRKLLSSGRDNVNTNFGYRSKLLDQLEDLGGIQLRPSIAGAALHNASPRGIQGGIAGGIGSVGLMSMNPLTIPALMTQSPRLVGEAVHLAGRAAGIVRTATGAVDLLKSVRPLRPAGTNSLQALADLEENRLREQKRRMEGK
jgi:hypothetical protein